MSPLSEWLFWLALLAMCLIGRAFGVGLFLGRFCLAAAAACVGALVFGADLQQQLQLFLFTGGSLLVVGRLLRVRKIRRANAA